MRAGKRNQYVPGADVIPLRNGKESFVNPVSVTEVNRTDADVLNLDDRNTSLAKLTALKSIA
jgi:hypothetical protein